MVMHGARPSIGREESIQQSSPVALCRVIQLVHVPFLPTPVFMKDVD